MNRRRRYRHTDWAHYHRAYLLEWADRSNRSRDVPQIHRRPHFVSYLRWLHSVARLQLRLAMTQADIGEGDSSEEDIVDEYDEFTRTGTQLERAPINAYYVSKCYPCTIFQCHGWQTFYIVKLFTGKAARTHMQRGR